MNNKSLFKNSIYFILYRLINVIYPLITTTYVSRILKPTGIGEVAYVQNIVIFLVAFALLGIPNYGVREISKINDKKRESKIFSELFIINSISTTIIVLCYYTIINFLHLNINRLLFNIEGIIILLNYFNVDWFYQGKEEFKYITIRSAIVKVISMIAIFLFVKDENDMCIFALIFALAYAGNYLFNIINLRNFIEFSFVNLNFKKHIRPILTLAVTYISNEIYVTIDTVMLGILTENSQVGYYTNSMKLIRILINVCTAFGTAMLPRLSKLKNEQNEEKLNEIINKGIKVLLWITIPCVIGIVMVSDELSLTLFGKDFLYSGKILKFLSVLIIIRTFSNLFLQILICDSKDKKTSVTYFLGMLLNILLNYILIAKYNAIGASIASVISEMFICFMLFIFARKEYIYKCNITFFMSELVSSLILIFTILIVQYFFKNIYIRLIIEVIVGGAIYIISCIASKNEIIYTIINKIKKGEKNVIKSRN